MPDLTLEMPRIGELKKASELGHKGSYQYIWSSCVDCGKERWVIVVDNKPQWQRCRSCAQINSKRVKVKGEKHGRWKGGTHFDGRYNKIHNRSHHRTDKNGYVFEHILIWEEANQELLPDGWIVHHINGIRTDNRPRNLLAMPKKNHSPALTTKEVQKRLREIEIENRQLRRALEDSQLIWLGEN